ncbi:hypothetical protein PB16LOC_03706 [Pectobacterium versatile]|uniref:hypothetical protein n=1 Tax=Pectobacterium versatile TaxID=2488639 RepID=UPI000F8EE4C0|nr:hypothetical protein [Pectobacterium versatile]RUR89872.1 hypothetical protein PB16LOC_03706 [Pectobacterium versatile]
MKMTTFTPSQIDDLHAAIERFTFPHQAVWQRVGRLNVDRTITKSRQIGHRPSTIRSWPHEKA